MAPLLKVTGLRKAFGDTVAVAGIDLAVHAGEILGLLGANGAGKTTTVECIAGLTTPDAGQVDWMDTAQPRRGLAPQATGLPPKLTVAETLHLFASLNHAADESHALMARFRLTAKADAACETLSPGTATRLGLALALIGDPALVILDEPTAGLDPLARRDLHDLVLALRDAGRGILVTTHDMAEANRLCDRVAIMAAGRIVATGPPAVLTAGGQQRVTLRTDRPLAAGLVATIAAGADTRQDGAETVFTLTDPRSLVERLAATLLSNDIALLSLETTGGSLDDLVIAIGRHDAG